jgi:hypothetical protein
LKISKQISDRYPFTIDVDQTRIHFTLDQNSSTIEMHLNRRDEQLADLRANPKCSFEVDEMLGTIPSYWIHPANAAFATAYYRVVIFECDVVLSEDPKVLAAHQQRLMQHHQPDGGYEPLSAENAMYHGSLNSIAALNLTIRECKVKWNPVSTGTRTAHRLTGS